MMFYNITAIIIFLAGLIISAYGIILCVLSNLNLGVVLVAVLGLFILCVGLFYNKFKRLTSRGFFKYCKLIVILLLTAEVILISFMAIYGINDNVDYKEDAVVVLGAGVRGDKVTLPLKFRLDRAIYYNSKNPEALIVVTGGKGFQETVTEAYAMKKYLVENGVSVDKIIMEEKAVSTQENMMFTKKILDGYFDGDYSLAVVTNNFHIFRATSIAKKTGFADVRHLHAGLQWYNILPCYLRESLAVLKMFVLD